MKFKVVLISILLFLCFSKNVYAVDDMLLDKETLRESEKIRIEDEIKQTENTNEIEIAINNEGGGLFETTIAKTLGGLAQAVFDISTSETINLGFKNYDELIFNKTVFSEYSLENIYPFDMETWENVMKWYKLFSMISFVLILIGAIISSYRFIISGVNSQRRNEAKDSLFRLILGGVAISMAPLFVKILLIINANMVSALVNMTTGELDGLLGNSIFTQISTGNAIATALVICLFAYLFIKFNIKFIIRKFTLIVFIVFTPIITRNVDYKQECKWSSYMVWTDNYKCIYAICLCFFIFNIYGFYKYK